jgi:hypothetical protein
VAVSAGLPVPPAGKPAVRVDKPMLPVDKPISLAGKPDGLCLRENRCRVEKIRIASSVEFIFFLH